MISYEVYKIIHIMSIILVVGFAAMQFYADQMTKKVKILSGVFSFLLFVAGMGLIARLNISHGEPWPMWIKVKVGLWVVLAAAGPIMAKRLKTGREKGFWAIIFIIFLAVYTAITKLA